MSTLDMMSCVFCVFYCNGDHLALHLLTHTIPIRRSSEFEVGDGDNDPHRRVVHRQADERHDEGQHGECQGTNPQRPILHMQRRRHFSSFSMRSPSRPRGRSSSTRNIRTYIEASPAEDTKWMVSPRTTPTSKIGRAHV